MKTVLISFAVLLALTPGAWGASTPRSSTDATFVTGSPATTNNDDSCDVTTQPAATLLLPYFEVDFQSPRSSARTTTFTIINTSRLPQIAKVELWTDRAFPVWGFNIYLTGYDMQTVDLYDVIGSGQVPQTSSGTAVGPRSASSSGNPNHLGTATTDCASAGSIVSPVLLADVQSAFTTGLMSGTGSTQIGNSHTNAIGYATIDVVATCTTSVATDPNYFTSVILFDNVLIGDYTLVNPHTTTGNFATSSPLVHLRAIPEGGPAGSVTTTNLPYTFYDRFTGAVNRKADRRQPLPGAFAARFIEAGTAIFSTSMITWREGTNAGSGAASTYPANATIPVTEFIRFDERENGTAFAGFSPTLPATSRTNTTASSVFPPNVSGDPGGWMYLNLHNGGSAAYGTRTVSQNLVVIHIESEGRYAGDMEAMAMGNGCSIRPGAGSTIGPAPNVTPITAP